MISKDLIKEQIGVMVDTLSTMEDKAAAKEFLCETLSAIIVAALYSADVIIVPGIPLSGVVTTSGSPIAGQTIDKGTGKLT